ncbi:MAG: T9SS type A sorting domain-containing protein, partial [Sphingobacteriaceae bacterium]|nr:T9SS type A sorting domain-containing protein [Cytophagaceae bacterium]
FTAQLSNASGVFAASPVSLGLVTPGALNTVVIPAGTPAGTGYKIRVVSSNPEVTSAGSANFRVKSCGNNRESAPEAGLRVVVSPNPSPEGRLRISVSGAEGQGLRVELFNGTGQTVREQKLSKAGEEEVLDWDITRQPGGLYLLRVSDGREAKTLKVLH